MCGLIPYTRTHAQLFLLAVALHSLYRRKDGCLFMCVCKKVDLGKIGGEKKHGCLFSGYNFNSSTFYLV
jgi:hypothetical protein